MDHEWARRNSDESVQVNKSVENQDPIVESVDEFDAADNAVVDLLTRARYATTSSYKTHLFDRLDGQMKIEKRRHSMFKRLFLTAATAGIAALVILGLGFVLVPDAAAQTGQLLVRFVEAASNLVPLQTMGRTLPSESISVPTPDPSAFGTPPKVAFPVQPGQPIPTPVPPALAPGDKRTGTAPPLPPVPSNVPNGSFISLSEAQGKVSFKIRVPSWLPEGYALKGAVAPPQLPGNTTLPSDLSKTDPNAPKIVELPPSVTLVFGNSTGELLFLTEISIPTGKVPKSPIDVPALNASVENLSVNGQSGQYIEGNGTHQLHWQSSDGGIQYDLSSQALKRSDLLNIAQSVK